MRRTDDLALTHPSAFTRAGITALACLALLAGGTCANSETMDALIQAAKKEGQVVVYSDESDGQVADTRKAFQDKYGIKVQATKLTASVIASRYSGERQGHVVVADAIIVADDPFIADNAAWWVPLSDAVVPGYGNFPASERNPFWATINHNVIGIAWNTDLVKGADIPKGYEDLVTNPAFASRGSIVYADPRAAPNAMSLFKILIEKYGEGYFKKLMDDGVAVAASGPAGIQQVGAGAAKVMIGIMPNNAQTVMAAGAPVAYISVKDPATGSDNRIALSNGARHPNAARLYAAWRISNEGQRVMCLAKGSTSPLGNLPGCEPAAPPNYIQPNYRIATDRAWQAKYLPLLGLSPL